MQHPNNGKKRGRDDDEEAVVGPTMRSKRIV